MSGVVITEIDGLRSLERSSVLAAVFQLGMGAVWMSEAKVLVLSSTTQTRDMLRGVSAR